jgi:hypothetical protein
MNYRMADVSAWTNATTRGPLVIEAHRGARTIFAKQPIDLSRTGGELRSDERFVGTLIVPGVKNFLLLWSWRQFILTIRHEGCCLPQALPQPLERMGLV